MEFDIVDRHVRCTVPSLLVYGILRMELEPLAPRPAKRRVAALVTEYRHNSHADIILSRIFQTDTLDGRGRDSRLEVVSLYTDQRPAGDTSRFLAASHGFRVSETIDDALTLGTGALAVDGVLLIAEHGNYERTATGNIAYPKRRFWEETLAVFRKCGRSVPVFIDKHLADNWADAKFIYDTAREVGAPLMAGSSLPVTWRRPAADVGRGAKLEEIVAITFHTTDAYGFHALELAQALAEQRAGGETGILAAQAVLGDDVWRALGTEFPGRRRSHGAGSPTAPRPAERPAIIDRDLFRDAWRRLSTPALLAGRARHEGAGAQDLPTRVRRRTPAEPRRAERRRERVVRGLARRPGAFPIRALLDAGRPPRNALHVPAAGHRGDDAHGSTDLERRANAAHERSAGRLADLAIEGWAPGSRRRT